MGLTLRDMNAMQLPSFERINVDGTDDAAFHAMLRARGEAKAEELRALERERRRAEEEVERVRRYLDDVNALLRDEGLPLIPDPAGPVKSSPPFVPGNRSSKMPPRRDAFAGMSLADAVDEILRGGRQIHADELVREIFEIKDAAGHKAAKHSLVSALALGAKNGRWKRPAPNVYRLPSDGGAMRGQ